MHLLEAYRPKVTEEQSTALAPKTLGAKETELLIVGIQATICPAVMAEFQGRELAAWQNVDLDEHIDKAFDCGATAQELVDVFLTAGTLRGVVCWSHGLERLDGVIQKRSKEGKVTPRE